MGNLVDLEVVRLLHYERIREEALRRFPWQEVEMISEGVLEPMTRFWSDSKQQMITELLYRLVYECYLFGMLENRRAHFYKKELGKSHAWEDVYVHFYQKECNQLVYRVAGDFAMNDWLDEWRCETIFVLLEDVARTWFLEGAQVVNQKVKLP